MAGTDPEFPLGNSALKYPYRKWHAMNDSTTYAEAKHFVLTSGKAGISIIQRQFIMGYAAAKRIIDQMENEGIISSRQPDGKWLVLNTTTRKIMSQSDVEALQVHTLIGTENRSGGIMLCGINHGYSKQDEKLDTSGVDRSDPYKSFFSDKAVNEYRMRNRIVEWFRLWGYELAGRPETAGVFEKSIVQTNWLQTVTNNVSGVNVRTACIADCESFLLTCETLRPKVLIFLSQQLLWAFTSAELSDRVHAIFGTPITQTEWLRKEIREDGKVLRRFKVGFLEYEHLKVISLPHPTGSKGLADSYITSFKPEIGNVIDSWWAGHKMLHG